MKCGKSLEQRMPDGDNKLRHVCPACGYIHYRQPKIAAGVVVPYDGGVILIRRGVEPRKGFWSFPCGFMEIDETAEQAAIRETREESGVEVELEGHIGTYSYTQSWHDVSVVVVVYLGRVLKGTPVPGDDATEIKVVGPKEIPWNDLAFTSSHAALTDWLARRK
jgi:ADP-ribose pyrophosphatase YjhB (NUDIX family)